MEYTMGYICQNYGIYLTNTWQYLLIIGYIKQKLRDILGKSMGYIWQKLLDIFGKNYWIYLPKL